MLKRTKVYVIISGKYASRTWTPVHPCPL